MPPSLAERLIVPGDKLGAAEFFWFVGKRGRGKEKWKEETLVESQPNQQRSLNKLPTELQWRNFVTKHPLSIHTNRCQTCKNVRMQCVPIYSN